MSATLPASESQRRLWHAGELAAQRNSGKGVTPPIIRCFITEQMRGFFPHLPLLLAGCAGEDGFPCATFLQAEPGFIACPSPKLLQVKAAPLPGDPLAEALRPGAQLGLLGIDFQARRRNRVNGLVLSAPADGFALEVQEAVGNCPKYIHPRELFSRPEGAAQARWQRLDALDEAAKNLIADADMFFVASCAASGFDVSHRGGQPGFVTFDSDGALVIPDFKGNNYFNTLGNLLLQPKAGLLFLDFASGAALQVSGTAAIDWDGPEQAIEGPERVRRLRPTGLRVLRGASPIGSTATRMAPETPKVAPMA